MIIIYYLDRKSEEYQTTSYNCQGGFFMILESDGNELKTTCIPSSIISKVVVTQDV